MAEGSASGNPQAGSAATSNSSLATTTNDQPKSSAAGKPTTSAPSKGRTPVQSPSPSSYASPFSSRDSSPARTSTRQRVTSTAPQAATQRKNSTDPSPHRNPPSLPGVQTTTPSAAAIQRALSTTASPALQPSSTTSDAFSKLPRASRTATTSTNEDATTTSPISPRMKSPPPSSSGSRRNSMNKANTTKKQDPPSIVVQASTPVSATPEMKGKESPLASLDQVIAQQSGRAHRANRGASGAPSLATVEEGSSPSTPSTELGEGDSLTRQTTAERTPAPQQSSTDSSFTTDLSASTELAKPTESGSDSAGKMTKSKDDKKAQDSEHTPRPKTVQPKSSYQSLASLKHKSAAEPSSRKMTVETETVSSAAQSAIGGGDRAASSKAEGSLRLKPSNETIRPKKERKKPRKAPSINSGTASSKADIFEAKVASAVDDVDSSDSDETFVYESNPPDSQPRRSRHHSRTPSTTSMQSMADPRSGLRTLTGVLNTDRGVSGKRSMKFANNPYNSSGADDDSFIAAQEGRGGTIRPSAGSGVHHHHITRQNRGGYGPHYTGPEEEAGSSPFTLASKRSGGANSRTPSRPSSPRFANSTPRSYGNGTSRKNEVYNSYDLDGDGADDERTPLMGTVRTARNSRQGRVAGNVRLRQLERSEHPRSYWIKRFAGCSVMIIMIAAVVFGAVGFFFVTTKPLYDVDVRAIEHVLASEQEIMLDLQVEAMNPNLMTISISDMDINVFAKSNYSGSEKWWRDHGKPPPPISKASFHQRRAGGDAEAAGRSWFNFPGWGDDDDGYDPPDAEGDAKMLLLGRVLHFDNALTFEGSPIKRHLHYSVGELRVPHPANKTEAGGTERWERVLQHPFQLIVRGILKYSLPLSTHIIAAPIDAAVTVHPEQGTDKEGNLVVGQTKHFGWRFDPKDPDPFFTHVGVKETQPGHDHHASKPGTIGWSAKFRLAV